MLTGKWKKNRSAAEESSSTTEREEAGIFHSALE
jgi:hypothetical protein